MIVSPRSSLKIAYIVDITSSIPIIHTWNGAFSLLERHRYAFIHYGSRVVGEHHHDTVTCRGARCGAVVVTRLEKPLPPCRIERGRDQFRRRRRSMRHGVSGFSRRVTTTAPHR